MSDDGFEKISITDIVPSVYNPRKINNREYEKLSNSINEFGVISPIILNLKNNHIIGGHQRYDVLYDEYTNNGSFKDLYLIRVGDIGWVFPSSDLSVDDISTEKAMNLALNKISGEWDVPKLENLLIDLDVEEYDLDLTGFDNLDFEEFSIDLKQNIKLPKDEPVRNVSDNHQVEEDTIINTEDEDTDDESENVDDFEVTFSRQEVIEDDYPVEEETTENEGIETEIEHGDLFQLGNHRLLCGDATRSENIEKLIDNNIIDMIFTDPPYDLEGDYVSNLFKYSKNNAEIFVMHNERELAKYIVKYDKFFRRLFCVDFKVARLINSNLAMTRVDYVAHFRREAPTNFINLHDEFTTLVECSKTSKKDRNNYNHKHAKQVKLPSEFIQHYSREEENVLDIFGGAGSTLIACEQLNRNCFMMELEPVYCQVIINRWEEFTGEKAVKL